MNILLRKISQSSAKVKSNYTTGSMLAYCAVYQYAAYKEQHRFSPEEPVKAFRKPPPQLISGLSFEDILADYPELTKEDIRACLLFASDRERKLQVSE
ncbi:MAG: DUF433 domain-containing protein [Lentimicrobium sp.]|uniref:DUF433 domain-containing protein n=1 Tax=Lentimicrobium sp. TaxID=2034841 RepID=UPI0025EA0F3A|nr:DUF433 domain-containing protein [Lentimicrobium sp.]MCO5256607.1 DUF433 domain-containing protein [Lentimicrobium sp.]